MIDHEFARCAEDVVWRRSKLGLRLDAAAIARVDAHVARRLANEGQATPLPILS